MPEPVSALPGVGSFAGIDVMVFIHLLGYRQPSRSAAR
jgi:hypothetical protein